jgi:hypothetical protein
LRQVTIRISEAYFTKGDIEALNKMEHLKTNTGADVGGLKTRGLFPTRIKLNRIRRELGARQTAHTLRNLEELPIEAVAKDADKAKK